MIKKYKHLSAVDKKRIEIFMKLKFLMKKAFKWSLACFGIIILFLVGISAFYFVLDQNKSKNNNIMNLENKKNNFKSIETLNLNELSKKELERESEKEEIISKSVDTSKDESKLKFYDFSNWNDKCSEELRVVNGGNCLPKDFKVKTKSCRGKEVNVIIAQDLEQMICDAKKENISLWISSGYRNIELQTILFDRQVEREKSKEVVNQEEAEKRASKVVARPYASEHNTGLAVDFNGVNDDFYKTKEYKWLMDNAHKYGFIERYRDKWQQYTGVIYEPWHFRYIGKENASKVKESGLCLEEYIKKNFINNLSEEDL